MVTRLPARGLTEGAILAALVALLALASRYLPLIGVGAALVCPLPLTLLVLRRGTRVAVLAALVATAIGTLVAGPLTGAILLVSFAPLGIALGIGVRQYRSSQAIVFLSSLVVIISLVIDLGLTLVVTGVNPYTVMIEGMHQGLQMASSFYARLGMSRQQIEQAAATMRLSLELFPRLIPVFIVFGGVVFAWINFEVGRLVLRKFGQTLPALPPMTTWRVPMLFIWVLLVGFLLAVWAQLTVVPVALTARTWRLLPADDVAAILGTAPTRYPGVETVALNVLVIAQILFSLQGFLVGWVLMERYRMPRWYRWVIIVLALTTPLIERAAFFLGAADAVFGLRRRWLPAASH